MSGRFRALTSSSSSLNHLININLQTHLFPPIFVRFVIHPIWITSRLALRPLRFVFFCLIPAFCHFLQLFLLDCAWCFINHGAFGAALKPAHAAAHRWSMHCEAQPLKFVDRECSAFFLFCRLRRSLSVVLPLLVDVTRQLAEFVHTRATNLVLLPNATSGLNAVFRSLAWPPGSSILRLNIAYGATKKMMQFLHDKHENVAVHEVVVSMEGVSRVSIVTAVRAKLEQLAEASSTPKLFVFDHITSNQGIVLPARELIELSREFGVPVLVDGAHALRWH